MFPPPTTKQVQLFIGEVCAPALRFPKVFVLAYNLFGLATAIGVYVVGFVSSANPFNEPHFIGAGMFFVASILQCSLLTFVFQVALNAKLIMWPLRWRVAAYVGTFVALISLVAFTLAPEDDPSSSHEAIAEYILATAITVASLGLQKPILDCAMEMHFVSPKPPSCIDIDDRVETEDRTKLVGCASDSIFTSGVYKT